ncbi:hypothetical protein TD95_002387 [Thielaviopsis punctulata]|uniref:ABC transporter n=1 Tax=Thielaviopsis punctulata TaxID=72032 RepID=A0A0F4ZGG9_9PEZI|nr:hypothetical protein TD95_002387 [Thielaviopsis punctulata]
MDTCSRSAQIPEDAAFNEACLPLLSATPTVISALVLFLSTLKGIWKKRPIWLRNFAAEDFGDEVPSSRTDETWASARFVAGGVALMGWFVTVAMYIRSGSFVFAVGVVPLMVTALWTVFSSNAGFPLGILLIHMVLLVMQVAIALGTPVIQQNPVFLSCWLISMLAPSTIVAYISTLPLRPQWAASAEIAVPFEKPTNTLRSPEDNMSLWQWISVRWMNPLIAIGAQRQLHDEDVWKLPLDFQHARLHTFFTGMSGSVIVRLLKANGPDLIITTLLAFLESGLSFASIMFLKFLLGALGTSNGSPALLEPIQKGNVRAAVVYAVLILIANVACAQSQVFSLWFSRRAYERSRGEMITMIYEKTLRRKAFTFPGHREDDGDGDGDGQTEDKNSPASTGKILNLMRNDVYEIAQRFWEFPRMFTFPLDLVISTALIWNMLGASALLGILVLLAAQVFNVLLLKVMYSWEHTRRGISDSKLQLVSQFIEALRHLRWYDWQDRWLTQILEVRERELRFRVWTGLLNKFVGVVNRLAAYLFPVVAFWTFTVIGGHKLTVDVAFPALSLFTMLQTSLRQLPDLITTLLNASVAMGRIERFMAEPDREEFSHDAQEYIASTDPVTLSITDARFSWPGSESSVLDKVTISCTTGLTAVYGKVGSGKTALLHAILGELDCHAGTLCIPDEKMAYCAQTPWLQSMTIRENILFCAPLDEKRYRAVLDACCLLPDLAGFPAGDLSAIGENGIGLSGGQRARVALARAVYSTARVLLLDDPLAALDHHTAESIMSKLFAGDLMHGRTVVFVTHRVDLVKPYAAQEINVERSTVRVSRALDSEASTMLALPSTSEPTSIPGSPEAEEAHDEFKDAIPDKFIEEEKRAHGSVVAMVYWRFIKAGKLYWWAAIVISFLVYRGVNVLYFYFLKIWGEAYKTATQDELFVVSSETATAWAFPDVKTLLQRLLDLPSPEANVRPWLYAFAALSVIQVIAQVIPDVVLLALSYTAGRSIFKTALERIATSTFRFLDVTPVGRLMNRVTSDMSNVDGAVASDIYYCVWDGVTWTSAMLVIALTAPSFLGLAVLLTIVFVFVFLHFLPCSQSLRRLEMVSLSPLMSNFGTLVEGLTTVRAFHAQSHFRDANIKTTDAFQQMDHFYWSLQAWLQSRFDNMSAVATFTLTLAAVLGPHGSGTVAFVLAAAANFVGTTHILCRRYGELQMKFVSVERVIELLDLQQEAVGDIEPAAEWPSAEDDVVFDNVTVRYAPHLEPSLRNISMRIPAGAMVAVTGRTGSGKSTLALALLATLSPDAPTAADQDGYSYSDNPPTPQLVDTTVAESEGLSSPPGSIWIGPVDISRVDKHVLRQRISFVAQDPVLFPGTLRDNLDPSHSFSDASCAAVVARVMHDSGSFSLTTRIDGGGKNLSQGQRQLVGLARAVLRRSRIVILDEATASIDAVTAGYIQDVLREELKGSTVFTIAHRVEAVQKADYSVVLEGGRLVYAGKRQ